jgi:alcohol dehydrogenase (cytochrome c)
MVDRPAADARPAGNDNQRRFRPDIAKLHADFVMALAARKPAPIALEPEDFMARAICYEALIDRFKLRLTASKTPPRTSQSLPSATLTSHAPSMPIWATSRSPSASVTSTTTAVRPAPLSAARAATAASQRLPPTTRHGTGGDDKVKRPRSRNRAEEAMPTSRFTKQSRLKHALLATALLSALPVAATPALAAEVTPERLANPDKEPQNWLMNHRSYDAQRFSPLDTINRDNVGNLKLAYAVALGGTSAAENLQATPLVEDGFMYVVDLWGIVYKIDVRSGEAGRIVWRMDPKQEKFPLSNRGAALWGNLVISVASYPARVIATNKDTGKVEWETNIDDRQVDLQITAAPLAVKDKILVGAAGGDRGVRDFIAGLDARTGKVAWRNYVVPAPGEPGSETWKDHHNAWQTGGGAMWVTGSYDVATNQVIWGTGNPVPMFDPTYRPGDNLYTDSMISWDPDSGKMNWYFQYLPGDMWDYDEEGSHILIDGEIGGQKHTLVTHSSRNGFLYTFERANGQPVMAKPYLERITWTKGIDQKTGKPLDYDPGKDLQAYSGMQNQTLADPTKKLCPSMNGGNNFWPPAYSPKTKLIYIPALTSCNQLTLDPSLSNKAGGWKGATFKHIERNESDLIAADPLTGDIKKRIHISYPDQSGALATNGGLVFTAFEDGTVAAYDDSTLEQLWKFNAGVGFMAPPMTFEVNGKQYVAILSGLSRIAIGSISFTPELKEQRNQTMLFVFGL